MTTVDEKKPVPPLLMRRTNPRYHSSCGKEKTHCRRLMGDKAAQPPETGKNSRDEGSRRAPCRLAPPGGSLNRGNCHALLFPGHRFQYFADFRRHALSYHRLRRFARGQMRNLECGMRNKKRTEVEFFPFYRLTGEQTVNFSDSLFTSHFFVLYCKMRYHVKRDSGACVKVRAGEGQNALRTRRGRELRAQTRGRKERKPDEQQPSTL